MTEFLLTEEKKEKVVERDRMLEPLDENNNFFKHLGLVIKLKISFSIIWILAY